MFADDTKISRKIPNDNGGALLQQELDPWTVYDGMVEGLSLDFNVEKCKIMRVKHSFQTEYELNGRKLQYAKAAGSEGNASSGCHQE